MATGRARAAAAWWQRQRAQAADRLRGPAIEPAEASAGQTTDREPAHPLDVLLPVQHDDPPEAHASDFGTPGRPVNRTNPFYLGFVGALGVFGAVALVTALRDLAGVLTLLLVSVFLALGLDPVVQFLERHGLPRPAAVAAVFVGLLAVVGGFLTAVVPLAVIEATDLAAAAPGYVVQVQEAAWFRRLDEEYEVVSTFSEQLQARLTSGDTVASIFGGVLGAGRAVIGGVFSTFTVLILTLYFLASLRSMKEAAYRLVPRSRRRRVQLLSDEIIKRVGGYVIGQIAVASINGIATYIVLSILGLPFAGLLALVVGILGLIPLVGATLGAIVVCLVTAFTSIPQALFLAGYYVVYQQIENYLIAPRVMSRTVSVPGALSVVAAIAGASLLGVVGALVAIPIAAGMLLIIQEVWMPRQERT